MWWYDAHRAVQPQTRDFKAMNELQVVPENSNAVPAIPLVVGDVAALHAQLVHQWIHADGFVVEICGKMHSSAPLPNTLFSLSSAMPCSVAGGVMTCNAMLSACRDQHTWSPLLGSSLLRWTGATATSVGGAA